MRNPSASDEPVAAALGYGMGLLQDALALVLDFGGGTFHLALVHLSPAGTRQGECRVLAKIRSARLEIAFGVNADRWLTATVSDLKTRRLLMDEQPVVRLL